MARPPATSGGTTPASVRYTGPARTPHATDHTRTAHTRPSRALLPAERAQQVARRAKNREEYNNEIADVQAKLDDWAQGLHERDPRHAPEYYMADMLHRSRMKETQRGDNRWNAYVSMRTREVNDALPPGAPRLKVSDPELLAKISMEWQEMTKSQRMQVTEQTAKELAEAKAAKASRLVPHVTLEVAKDCKKTLKKIHHELDLLYQRTSIEMIMITSRPDLEQSYKPTLYYSSDRARNFFPTQFNVATSDLPTLLECYCLNGVDGLRTKAVDVLRELQTKTANLIAEKLKQVTGYRAKRMNYQGFHAITATFRVVIDGWPADDFKPPSDFKRIQSVEQLYNAWESGTCHFRVMDAEEWKEWDRQRFGGDEGDGDGDGGGGGEGEGEGEGEGDQDGGTEGCEDAATGSKRRAPDNQSGANKRARKGDVVIGTTASGSPLYITPKERKTRSDAGTKKKKTVPPSAATPSAATPSSPTPSSPTPSCTAPSSSTPTSFTPTPSMSATPSSTPSTSATPSSTTSPSTVASPSSTPATSPSPSTSPTTPASTSSMASPDPTATAPTNPTPHGSCEPQMSATSPSAASTSGLPATHSIQSLPSLQSQAMPSGVTNGSRTVPPLASSGCNTSQSILDVDDGPFSFARFLVRQ